MCISHALNASGHSGFLRFAFYRHAFQLNVLDFAFSLALWVVLTYMKALLSLMARIRIMDTVIRILSYLDNWFLYAPTIEQGIQDTATLLKQITPLGLAA